MDVDTCKIIAEHVLSCYTCKHDGILFCPELKLLDGVYNDVDFILALLE